MLPQEVGGRGASNRHTLRQPPSLASSMAGGVAAASSAAAGASAGSPGGAENGGGGSTSADSGYSSKCPPGWSSSDDSTTSSSSSEGLPALVFSRLLKLWRASSLPLPQHHLHPSPGGANVSFPRLLWAAVVLVLGTAALLTFQQALAARRAITYAHAGPNRARVVGGVAAAFRAGHGVMGTGDCVPADILLGGRLGPSGDGSGSGKGNGVSWPGEWEEEAEGGQRPIPMVATNLDFDTERFLTRWVSGLDYPIRHTFIAWGGCDPLVAEQAEWVLRELPHVRLFRARRPLGCAGGWNAVLQYMSAHDVPWAIVFNHDIKTPPGALAAFAAELWAAIDADPRLCIGHFATEGAGVAGRYTSFVYTRHALNTLGLVDANLYPAYYEDVELDIRLSKAVAAGACSPIPMFNASRFIHGKEGQRRYVSGSRVAQQRLMAHGDRAARAAARAWSERIQRGKLSSPLYLNHKWGCEPAAELEVETCTFAHPFDDPRRPLSFWELDVGRRRCIDDAGRGLVACPYTLEGQREEG